MPGLTSTQAQAKLREVGRNEIQEQKASFFIKLGRWLVSPISLMLIAASVLSWLAGHVFDAIFILALLLLNVTVTFWQEWKADKAVATLRAQLLTKTRTLRDGTWQELSSMELVPGDLIRLALGDIVPADVALTESHNISVNQAAITGESLPQNKLAG